MTIEDKLANLDRECMVYTITKMYGSEFAIEVWLKTSSNSPCRVANNGVNLHKIVDETIKLVQEHKYSCNLHY